MADLTFAVEIAAPSYLVFAFFVPQRMPYWYGTEIELCLEVQGASAEFDCGQKVRINGRVGWRNVSLTAVVMAYEWGRVFEWRFQDSFGVRGLQRWDVAPTATGTRVQMRDSYEMPGRYGHILDWLLTRHAVALRDRASLARLKRLVERR